MNKIDDWIDAMQEVLARKFDEDFLKIFEEDTDATEIRETEEDDGDSRAPS